MKIQRKKFFDGFRPYFKQIAGKPLTVAQVANLEFLLGAFEKSSWFSKDIRRIAYAIATIHIETFLPRINSRYAPVTEGGSKSYFNRYDKSTNPRKARELGNTELGDGYTYRGRGFCQITGRKNYRKFGIEDSPEMALDPQTAFNILERGMREGTFTGKKLSDFINASGADYKNARRVINGQDRAVEIAGYARNIEHFLREASSGEESTTTANEVTALVDSLPKTTGEPSESSPETSTTVEQTTVQADANSAISTTVTQEQNVVIEAAEPQGFISKIWKKITGISIFNGGLNGVSDYAQQVQAFGLTSSFWERVILIAAVASIIWLIYEGYAHWSKKREDREKDRLLASVNSTPTNTVQFATGDEIARLEAMGYKVIKRN